MPQKSKRKTNGNKAKKTRLRSTRRRTIYYLQNRLNNTKTLLDLYDVDYKWNIFKSDNEVIHYNYPTQLLNNVVKKYDELLKHISETERAKMSKIKVHQIITTLLKTTNQYSPLGITLRTDHFKTDKFWNDSYSFLQHKFLYGYFTLVWYYITQEFNILPIKLDKNYKALYISHYLSFAEAFIYKYIDNVDKKNINQILHTELLTYSYKGNYTYDKITNMNYVYEYNNISDITKIWSPSDLKKKIKDSDEINLGVATNYMLINKYALFRLNYNHLQILGSIILILSKLKLDGKLVLNIPGCSTKFSQDIIFILTQHFQLVQILDTIVQMPSYIGIYLYATGFKPTRNFKNDMKQLKILYEDMYKNDPTGGLNYIPNNPKIEKLMGVKHEKSKYVYYNSLLDVDDSTVYSGINEYMHQQLKNYSNYVDKLWFYYDNVYYNKDKINNILMINYNSSIQMAKYLGLKLNNIINEKIISESIVNNIYHDLYSINSLKYYPFRYYNKPLYIGSKNMFKSNQYLYRQVLRINNITSVLISRRFNDDRTTDKLQSYKQLLINLLVKTTNIGVSNGKSVIKPDNDWAKMYEILKTTDIITKNRKNYKVLSLNGLSGYFILPINHYIKTKTKIKNFDWTIQTNWNKHDIDDIYNIIKKYPDNIKFSNIENIKQISNIDLITLNNEYYGDINAFNYSKKMYDQLICILDILPDNKNFIAKYELSYVHQPVHLGLLYVIYQSFESFSIYNPLQNDTSNEVYIIGKKYNKLTSKQLDVFRFKTDEYNSNISPVNINKIPDEFLKQLEKITKNLVSQYIDHTEKYLYYIDLMEDGKNPDLNIVKKHIDIRNKEWIDTFEIEPIKNNDKLV